MNIHDIDIELPPLPPLHIVPSVEPVDYPEVAQVLLDYARAAVAADRKQNDRMLAHEWIRPALGLSEDAPYRFDFYAQQIEGMKADRQRRGEPVAWPTHEFAIVVDRIYEGEGPSLAMWNGENYNFTDGACYDREPDGSLDGYTAEWLTHHQLEQRLFSQQPAEPDYKQLFEQMCERCDALDAKLAEYSEREPVARVNDDGFIVETGLSLAPGTLPFTAPQPAEPVKVPSDDIDIDDVHQYLEAWGCLAHPGVRALLARYGQPVEPEGWQLVPKVPTEEMLAATSWPNCAGTDYSHMLKAAPKFGEEE